MKRSTVVTSLISAALLLTACSYGYVLKAEYVGGRVIFSSSQRKDGRKGSGCFANFTVKTTAGEVVWAWRSKAYSPPPCPNLLPVTYGVVPAGLEETTRAKPLKFDTSYLIEAWDGDSYDGSFRLKQAVVADNLPSPNHRWVR